jgi:hypothetical protein
VSARRSQQAHLDRGEDAQDHGETDRRGGRVTEVEVRERLLIDEVVDDPGGRDRAAARGDGDGVEDLERADQGDHQYQRQDRPQQWQGDAAEHPPFAGSVDRGALVQVLRDLQHPGVQQQRGVAGVGPRVDGRDGRHRPGRVGEEADRSQAERREQVVDEAEVGVQQPHPQQADGDVGDQPGQQQRRPEHDRAGQPVHQRRDASRNHHAARRSSRTFAAIRTTLLPATPFSE